MPTPTGLDSSNSSSNNQNKAWVMQDFEGGWSIDYKVGLKNSQAYTQGINFRDRPSQFSVKQQAQREDGGIVQDLIQNEVMVQNGIIYALGSTGYVYERSSSGVWSNFGNVRNGYFGMDYRQDLDSVYLCSDKTVSLMNPISTGPSLQVDYYGISQSLYNNNANATVNVNANQTGSTNAVPILTTFNENQQQKRYFQTDIEPLSQISLYFQTVAASGTYTLTLHDGLNNVLGTITGNNSTLNPLQFNNFNFASQIRVSVAPAARTYHIHFTSTVSGSVVSGTANNDLSTCDLEIWADRLVIPTNGLHPMTNFQQYECIGNERYLSVWEPLGDPSPSNTEWQRHGLQFPPYYQVCGLTVFNEYLAIACERISTSGNTSSTQQDGIIFFWDGLSTTYNYFMKIPEGSPLGLVQHNNAIFYQAGTKWYTMTSPTSLPVSIRRMPEVSDEYTTTTTQTRVNPYAATVRRSTLIMGWPSTTTNPNIKFGVYSYGSTDKNFPDSFGYDYIISTGSQNYTNTNNLEIGMVQAFGNLTHISWRDNSNGNYGIDYINISSPPANYATWNSTIFDNGYVGKQKQAHYMEATWLTPLNSGITVVLKYQINRSGWVYSNNATTPTAVGGYTATNTWIDGDGYARFDIGELGSNTLGQSLEPGRFNEIQLGIDIYSNGAVSSPHITMVSLIFDPLGSEALQ